MYVCEFTLAMMYGFVTASVYFDFSDFLRFVPPSRLGRPDGVEAGTRNEDRQASTRRPTLCPDGDDEAE